MNTPVLEVTNLSKNFGGLRALNEVDLTINRQEIVALIGPNGAGKTTFFNCITGIYLPTEGTVQLHLPERNGKPASSTTLNGTEAQRDSRRSAWPARSRTSACSRP